MDDEGKKGNGSLKLKLFVGFDTREHYIGQKCVSTIQATRHCAWLEWQPYTS